MAQAKLKWESLPNDLRDINVFQPVIAQVMLMRFPSTQGYRHQILGNTEYRVRRGMFGGWDVRVWRQEHLIIDVSAGSRFNSALPIIAGLLALAGVAVLDGFNYLFNAAN